MVANQNLHQESGVTARTWMLAPPNQPWYFVHITDLFALGQDGADTIAATRRFIDFNDAGTDQHQVTIGDGIVSLIFEVDKNGIPLDGAGDVDIDLNNVTTPEEAAKVLERAIHASAIRDTVLVERIGPRIILRNDTTTPTDDITVASVDATFTVGTYLVYKPNLYERESPGVPDYCSVAVTVRPGETDDVATEARVVVYGLDPFDNYIECEVNAYCNGQDGERIMWYTREGFARVDEIRIYEFAGAEPDQTDPDELFVGYCLPTGYPLMTLPDATPPEFQEYVGSAGASPPFIHTCPVTPRYAMWAGRKTDRSESMKEDGVGAELDSTGLNAQNMSADDITHIGDTEEDLVLTWVAAAPGANEVLIGANANENADNLVTAINAAGTRFRAERYLDRILPAYGYVFVYGGNEDMFIEFFTPAVGPDPFATEIADVQYDPQRFLVLDSTDGVAAATDTVYEGDLVILEEDGVRDIFEFDDDATAVAGHFSVQTGANRAATMANLATAINTNATTNWRAIDISAGAHYELLLINANGTGRFWMVTGSNLNTWQNAKTPTWRRIPCIKSLVCLMNLQCIGAYNPVGGAPYNLYPLGTFSWDLFDHSWDPYGFTAVVGPGEQGNGGFRAHGYNAQANYGDIPWVSGGLVAMCFLANSSHHRNILLDFHSDFIRESRARQRERTGSINRGNQKGVTQRPAPPYFVLPDRSGGQR